MQRINIKKNEKLFENRSILVIGKSNERVLSYLSDIVDKNINKEIFIIDPKMSGNSYNGLQNSVIHRDEHYDPFQMESHINKWMYKPSEIGNIMILNNTLLVSTSFPRSDIIARLFVNCSNAIEISPFF